MGGTDEERGSFARKMVDILNCGALNVAIGIGYRVGLFEALDAFEGPATLSALAERAGLSSRYIREWLGVMVCGGIVELSREGGEELYFLPEAHGDILARRAGSANLGVYAQEIPLLTQCAMDGVLNGFRTGEGVGYEVYPRFQSFMEELAVAKHKQVLIEKFLPTVDDGGLVQRLEKGIRVCDLGCAEGTALLLMARAYPRSRFTGIDLSEEVIARARACASEQGLSNAEFAVLDAARLRDSEEYRGGFDYIMAFDAVHDQTRPLKAVQESTTRWLKAASSPWSILPPKQNWRKIGPTPWGHSCIPSACCTACR